MNNAARKSITWRVKKVVLVNLFQLIAFLIELIKSRGRSEQLSFGRKYVFSEYRGIALESREPLKLSSAWSIARTAGSGRILESVCAKVCDRNFQTFQRRACAMQRYLRAWWNNVRETFVKRVDRDVPLSKSFHHPALAGALFAFICLSVDCDGSFDLVLSRVAHAHTYLPLLFS